MLVKINEVTKKIKEKKEYIDEEMMTSIGHFVFDEAFAQIKSFDNLIININGFYSFFYTKKRLEELKQSIEHFLETGIVPLRNKVKLTFLPYSSKEEILQMLTKIDARLLDYEDYLKNKKINRDERIKLGEEKKKLSERKGN
jgi:hypothetical protein